ncbi:serine palmitoyltransferase component [Coemansia sp. RSA 2523]|nr:serine palmitoyltransferase component [Coemansia sp. RSA 1591]KAJ1762648.1 serine palmitoyltransferase component [Coemansia sp. RSA 1752]KAJ1776370.1 serine palmitoyltransferase component [Coemansia sp. RSA 1824]KAJ1789015.1 serine palmitoyltransferase component [Coemansia sp. RSA 1938]KAJ1790788.1 serine palmitoyltransferase component [Coemansia sp. RSA 2167]KAJ1802906.1 serine palmitoyltransferase component [Coemansia sp. RSA 2523]KAJ2142024.1 serine palmitoyltransferase component [Coema
MDSATSATFVAEEPNHGLVRKAWDVTFRMGLRYIKNSYKDDPFRTFLEVCLIGFIVWYITKQKYNIGTNEIVLSEKEIDELVDEWKPEPLVPALTEFEREALDKAVMIDGPNGTKVRLASGTNNKPVLNFASYNFLGFLDSPELGKHAVESLRKYGVGSCGPPGFYGTLDVHMELEKQIAAFIGHSSAILYSQAFTTTLSVIPCFSKRSDIIVADEGVNFAVQKAIYLSRSKVYWYKHNDMADLERILKDVNKQLVGRRGKNALPRKFIVTEGLFQNTGDITPLVDLVELKHRYKYRIILDESYSFGVLGKRGAGLTDHFNIDPHEVDLLIGALCYAVGASGGFCCADKDLVEHQRLSGLGYCFSASMPGILTIAAADAIQALEVDPDNYLGTMRENTTLLRTLLKRIPGLQVDGVAESPLIHIRLSPETLVRMKRSGGTWTKTDIDRVLIELSEEALKDGVLLMRATYVDEHERLLPNSSIRICVSSAHTRKEIEKCAHAIKSAVSRITSKKR